MSVVSWEGLGSGAELAAGRGGELAAGRGGGGATDLGRAGLSALGGIYGGVWGREEVRVFCRPEPLRNNERIISLSKAIPSKLYG